jgi:Na+-driven multidrug efflux pump
MRLLGSTETILPYACDYGMWVLIACPFMVCSLVLNNNLRYEGKAFYAMFGLTTGGLLNIFGDWLLVRRLEMGVFGAGLATAISQIVSFTILLILYFKTAQSTISIRAVSRRFSDYAGIVKVGFPSLIRQGLTSISQGLLNNLTKPYGDAAIAAMSVVNRFSSLVMCVGLGIGQGFQPVAAFNYRAKEYKRVKQGLIFTTVVGFTVVAILSLAGFLLAQPIIRIFQESEAVIRAGVPALRYATLGLLFLPLSVPVNMLYQSIRRAGVASFLSIMRSGLALIPTLILTEHFLGLTGIQMSQPIADMISGLICIPFIIHFLKHGEDEKEV